MFNSFQKQTLLHREIDKFKKTILSGETFLKKESILVFTCGKTPNKKNPGGRDLLLRYANRFLPEYHFFIAENFFKAITKFTSDTDEVLISDLLKIEEDLTKYSDCIIIVLESNSAIAELGAFTIKNELAETVLVINDVKFKDKQSFISLGPIKRVDEISKFSPVIYTKLESISSSFGAISDRIKRIKRGQNKRILFNSSKKFMVGYEERPNDKIKKFEKNRLLLIADFISLFSPLTYKELVYILKLFYGDNKYNFLIDEIRLLIALELIEKAGDYYFRTTKDTNLFFEFKGFNPRKFRSVVINHYFKQNRERFRVLNNRIKVA